MDVFLNSFILKSCTRPKGLAGKTQRPEKSTGNALDVTDLRQHVNLNTRKNVYWLSMISRKLKRTLERPCKRRNGRVVKAPLRKGKSKGKTIRSGCGVSAREAMKTHKETTEKLFRKYDALRPVDSGKATLFRDICEHVTGGKVTAEWLGECYEHWKLNSWEVQRTKDAVQSGYLSALEDLVYDHTKKAFTNGCDPGYGGLYIKVSEKDTGYDLEDFVSISAVPILVNFANDRLGGGYATNGFVQEEQITFTCNLFVALLKRMIRRPTNLTRVPRMYRVRQLCNVSQSPRYYGSKGFQALQDDFYENVGRRKSGVHVRPCPVTVAASGPADRYFDWLSMAAVPLGKSDMSKEKVFRIMNRMLHTATRAFILASLVCLGKHVHIATGNWGAGVFGHHPPTIARLQIIAASIACNYNLREETGKVIHLHYYPFGNSEVRLVLDYANECVIEWNTDPYAAKKRWVADTISHIRKAQNRSKKSFRSQKRNDTNSTLHRSSSSTSRKESTSTPTSGKAPRRTKSCPLRLKSATQKPPKSRSAIKASVSKKKARAQTKERIRRQKNLPATKKRAKKAPKLKGRVSHACVLDRLSRRDKKMFLNKLPRYVPTHTNWELYKEGLGPNSWHYCE